MTKIISLCAIAIALCIAIYALNWTKFISTCFGVIADCRFPKIVQNFINRQYVALYLNLINKICGKKLIKSVDSHLRESTPLKLQNRAIKGFKNDDKLCIGINPGAAYGSAKRWEEQYFVEIITHFLKNDCSVFIFGNDSLNLLPNIAQNPHLHNLTRKTTITELVDYIALMDIFISNDSGPMHIAAAFRVPLIAIFGATNSKETAPWVDNAVLLDKHLPCAPCKKRECPLGHHNCMKLITPDEVIESVNMFLH